MKYELNKNSLVLFFEGKLDSTNVQKFEEDAFGTIEGKNFTKLILDFSKLTYISSAGLRLVLKLKQKYDDLSIIEVSLEVYDTFNMTGFTELLDIRKALRKVDIEGAELIGSGYFSSVYRIAADTIIKVFNRTSDPGQIERELKLAKEAFILGIPTAISFDIVRVGEKLGVCFEMLDCSSLQGIVQKYPERAKEYAQKYSDLLKKINTTECKSPNIPSMKKHYQDKVEFIKPYLEDKYYQKAKKIIDNIEERTTLIHGDCHFKNIMVQNDELLLIDMDTLSTGHPIFELAQLYCPYIAFEEDDPGNVERFLGVAPEFTKKLYDTLVFNYFGKEDEDIKNKIRLVAYIHMIWWNRTNEPDNKVRLEGCKSRLISLLDKYDDVNF